MHILKSVLRGLSAYGFRASIFGFGFMIGVFMTFNTPDPLKSALQDSGLYTAPLSDLANIEESMPDSDESSSVSSVSIDDPLVQNAIETAFPSSKKQTLVEDVVDGSYSWLQGTTDSPDFSIDIADEKTLLINTLADSVFTRVDALPDCTFAQLQALNSQFDPLKITCKPPINLLSEKQKFINEYATNGGFLSDTKLDGEELFKETERHDSSNNLNNLPALFSFLMALPYIFAFTALATLLGVLLLSETKRKGTRKIGKLLVETSISLAIVGVGLYFVLGGVKASVGGGSSAALQTIIGNILDALRSDIFIPGIIVAALYFVIGVIILVLTRKKPMNEQPQSVPTPLQSSNPSNEVTESPTAGSSDELKEA